MARIKTLTTEQRLLNNVYHGLDGCWYWLGYLNVKSGYGHINVDGKTKIAHRVSYSMKYPDINIEGFLLCHTCDNKQCVNPYHLFVGTIQDNIKDFMNKGLSKKGEDIPFSKLKNHEVIEIMELKGTMSQSKIGKMFNTTQSNVWQIHNSKSWKHLFPKRPDYKPNN